MTLAIPKIVVLDSSTLGKVSRDYWDQDSCSRDKARTFIARLQDLDVFITFTLTHISELLRHRDEQIVWDRLKFLRSIPFITWLRPYDRSWFPAGIPDLLSRELHSVVYGSARNWRKIVDTVRPELWETGTGAEMFVDNDEFWLAINRESTRLHEKEKCIVSMGRTDPCQIKDLKIRDALRLPMRPKEKRDEYKLRLIQEIKRQMELHGDKRFDHSHRAAINLAISSLKDIETIDEKGGDFIQRWLEFLNIPEDFIFPETTIEEIGELAVYTKRLKMISQSLRPPIELTMKDVPKDTLPSYVLERKLALIQKKAERVSGSDLGDRHIAPLVFYTDGIEVDKRTCEFLKQIQRNEPKLASLMGRFFSSSDYSEIPKFFGE